MTAVEEQKLREMIAATEKEIHLMFVELVKWIQGDVEWNDTDTSSDAS